MTDDRVGLPRRTARPSLEQLFAAFYFDYSRYISPVTCREISFGQAVDWIVSEKSVETRRRGKNWMLKLARNVLASDQQRVPPRASV